MLIKPEPAETTPLIMKELKEESAKRIIRTLRENLRYPWCRKTLAKLRLPSTVHDESHYRLWQRRFYPFNVFSEKKVQQKLDYMHNNPVTRGLVSSLETGRGQAGGSTICRMRRFSAWVGCVEFDFTKSLRIRLQKSGVCASQRTSEGL